jgi:hypothetical protein
VSELPRSASGADPRARARTSRLTEASNARPLAGRAGAKSAGGDCWQPDAEPVGFAATPMNTAGAAT